MGGDEEKWMHDGVQVVPGDQLDCRDPKSMTPGMKRCVAINAPRVGAKTLWAGTVEIKANAKTGPHHHGELESVIYVVSGLARMRWGERLEFYDEAGPGGFIYVPPFVPHQEINAGESETLTCVLARSGTAEQTVWNLPNLDPVATPVRVPWVDPTHPATP